MKAWPVMWHLLFRRPLTLVLLGLVYLTGALLLVTLPPEKRGAAVSVIGALAAGGLSAVMSGRIARYAVSAGSLGIPGHAGALRHAQALFLTVFVVIPAVAAWLLGLPPLPTAAALLGATAAGIALSKYRLWWLMLLPAAARSPSLWHWLNFPAIQAAAVAVSAWLIKFWFDLPQECERLGEAAPWRLSDSRHERAARRSQSASSVSAGEPTDSELCSLEDADSHPASGISWDRAMPSVLAAGLGYSVRTDWRRVLYGAAAAITGLAVWHLLRGNEDSVAYTTVCAVCCFTVIGRLQIILNRWERTSVEQAILRITPLWPRDWPVKRAVLQSTLQAPVGAIAAWALLSAAAWILSLVSAGWIITAAAALFGTSLAFSASLWATLARRQIREWHLFTILAVITTGSGAVVTAVRPTHVGHLALGIAIMLVPPTAAVLWYLLAPLRVPVSVDARAPRLAS